MLEIVQHSLYQAANIPLEKVQESVQYPLAGTEATLYFSSGSNPVSGTLADVPTFDNW
jgi:hypothetical protein